VRLDVDHMAGRHRGLSAAPLNSRSAMLATFSTPIRTPVAAAMAQRLPEPAQDLTAVSKKSAS
jgi:hypothetical protein